MDNQDEELNQEFDELHLYSKLLNEHLYIVLYVIYSHYCLILVEWSINNKKSFSNLY